MGIVEGVLAVVCRKDWKEEEEVDPYTAYLHQ